MAGRVDVGPIRQGNALRAGGSDRSAGRDRLRSNPLLRKRRGCPHPHAHTRTPRARSNHEHVSLTSRFYVWRAFLWRCAMCRYVYAWRAQQCTAQCSANTRTYTALTHTQHCHFTSTTTFHRPPPRTCQGCGAQAAVQPAGQRPLRWTGPTALQSPLCGKRRGCPHPHAHTRTPRARSNNEHVSLTSRSYVWRAFLWMDVLCDGSECEWNEWNE